MLWQSSFPAPPSFYIARISDLTSTSTARKDRQSFAPSSYLSAQTVFHGVRTLPPLSARLRQYFLDLHSTPPPGKVIICLLFFFRELTYLTAQEMDSLSSRTISRGVLSWRASFLGRTSWWSSRNYFQIPPLHSFSGSITFLSSSN